MYTAPEITARVLGAMRRYAVWRAQPPAPVRPLPIDSGSIRSMLTATGGQTVLGEAFTRPLLAACGIALVPGGFAANAQAAKQMARQTGYPAAIKVVSPDILHKSDVGGIALNIRSDEELEQALVDMLVRVRNSVPQARIEGVLVEAMAFRGQEVILGMRRDPNFGPLMMFGLGGTAVELFGDVSFRVAPLTERDVRAMIAETHAGRLLSGFRGQPPIPLEGIIDAMLRLSQLALAFSEIDEMEINPLLVTADGRALALDGRVLLKSA